jgi:hypothetical protein
MNMRKCTICFLIAVLAFTLACSPSLTTADKLRQWRQGVWQLADGSYTIFTENHYFVVSASGDSTRANIYCGASQIRFTDKGIARKQTLRIRKFPGGDLKLLKDTPPSSNETQPILAVDMSQFQPGTCNTTEGIIYDSVSEETDDFILLSTCNGDREKLFPDGRSVYLPASGGEHWAYRIESWQ